MLGLELSWVRCVDGAELVDFGPAEEPPTEQRRVVFGLRDHGEWIRYRSENLRFYEKRVADLKDSMVEAYLRCASTEDFVNFASEYGLPGVWEPDERKQSLQSFISVREGFKKLFDREAGGIAAFNGISQQLQPNLTPYFTTWRDREPRLVYQPRNPNGFMLMEAALVLANAVAVQTCQHCSLPFLAGPLTSKRVGAYYCSNRCRVAAQRAETKRRTNRTAR